MLDIFLFWEPVVSLWGGRDVFEGINTSENEATHLLCSAQGFSCHTGLDQLSHVTNCVCEMKNIKFSHRFGVCDSAYITTRCHGDKQHDFPSAASCLTVRQFVMFLLRTERLCKWLSPSATRIPKRIVPSQRQCRPLVSPRFLSVARG